MVNSEFVTDEEIDAQINEGIKDLHGQVFMRNPDHHLVVTPDSIATTEGTTSYPLDATFMSVRGVYWVDGGRRIPIEPSPLQELDFSTDRGGPGRCWYRIVASGADGSDVRILFLPDPGTATYEVLYVRAPHQLTNDNDEYDGVSGWERYVILCAAHFCAVKEESFDMAATLALERDRVLAQILAMASKRDSSRPRRIADVRSRRLYRRDWYPLP